MVKVILWNDVRRSTPLLHSHAARGNERKNSSLERLLPSFSSRGMNTHIKQSLKVGIPKQSLGTRNIKVNSGSKSPYSVIFLARIACRYVTFELPDQYWVLAQALLVSYFVNLEEG
jgi:hypothetical protein